MKGNTVDRCVALRQNVVWEKEVLLSKDTLLLPVWRNQNLIELQSKQPRVIFVPNDPLFIAQASDIVLLGKENEKTIVALDFSHLEKEELTHIFKQGEFINILDIPQVLSSQYGSLLSYARGLLHWNNNSKFCGKCGSKTQSSDFGHVRICTQTACGKTIYPRLEPAIIVLLQRVSDRGEAQCLLARHVRLPHFWSTLAGFVDFGEQIEDAVIREVYEEVGLQATNVSYVSSQPWPFPSSLMLGFTAQTASNTLNLEQEEIEEAKWFTAKELHQGINDGSIVIPGEFSIAHKLILDWLNKVN